MHPIQIITLRDELQARQDQLEALQEALAGKTEENGKLDEELSFLRPKFTNLEQLNESLNDQIDDLNNQLKLLKDNVREQSEKNLKTVTEMESEKTLVDEALAKLSQEKQELSETLEKRENQLQNLQEQLASGTEAEALVGQLRDENQSLNEKLTILDEQMVEAIQAKDTQLAAMKESKYIWSFGSSATNSLLLCSVKRMMLNFLFRHGSFRAPQTATG